MSQRRSNLSIECLLIAGIRHSTTLKFWYKIGIHFKEINAYLKHFYSLILLRKWAVNSIISQLSRVRLILMFTFGKVRPLWKSKRIFLYSWKIESTMRHRPGVFLVVIETAIRLVVEFTKRPSIPPGLIDRQYRKHSRVNTFRNSQNISLWN